MKTWIRVAATARCLTACSSKPSEGEARQAVADLMATSASAPVVTIDGFTLTGCTRAEDTEGYRCDTRGTVVMDMMGRSDAHAIFASACFPPHNQDASKSQ